MRVLWFLLLQINALGWQPNNSKQFQFSIFSCSNELPFHIFLKNPTVSRIPPWIQGSQSRKKSSCPSIHCNSQQKLFLASENKTCNYRKMPIYVYIRAKKWFPTFCCPIWFAVLSHVHFVWKRPRQKQYNSWVGVRGPCYRVPYWKQTNTWFDMAGYGR